MEAITYVSILIFAVSILAILLVFINPVYVILYSFFRKISLSASTDNKPVISLIIVVRNSAEIIGTKIENSLTLKYPTDKYEIIVFSDGSTDDTVKISESYSEHGVQVFSSEGHEGKNHALNECAKKSRGDVLVFSDGDVEIGRNSLEQLTKHFSDPRVGGVCGKKIILRKDRTIEEAQDLYTKFANWIKELESRSGIVSSNDGDLYAIRRELFQPIPPGVTDDLYVCLSIVRQGKLFLFEKNAQALIAAPSRNPRHEVTRRRRIVSGSLKNLRIFRDLMNPFRYGPIAISLFCNKVLRRLMPVALCTLLLSSAILALTYPLIGVFLAGQIAFYSLGALYGWFLQDIDHGGFLKRPGSIVYYFLLGNWGTFLGLKDFCMNREAVKWEPE